MYARTVMRVDSSSICTSIKTNYTPRSLAPWSRFIDTWESVRAFIDPREGIVSNKALAREREP